MNFGKMSLESALRELCKKHGCEFVSLRAKGRSYITVTFREPREGNHYMSADFHTKLEGSVDQIDDELYDSAARLFAHSYPVTVKP